MQSATSVIASNNSPAAAVPRVIVTGVSSGYPSARWLNTVRARAIGLRDDRPGPNPTMQTWYYNDGSVRQVVVGGDAGVPPIRIRSKYQQQLLGCGPQYQPRQPTDEQLADQRRSGRGLRALRSQGLRPRPH